MPKYTISFEKSTLEIIVDHLGLNATFKKGKWSHTRPAYLIAKEKIHRNGQSNRLARKYHMYAKTKKHQLTADDFRERYDLFENKDYSHIVFASGGKIYVSELVG